MPLIRPINPMPDFVREALEAEGLMEKYEARPPYQRKRLSVVDLQRQA